jgi:hypothetical protein
MLSLSQELEAISAENIGAKAELEALQQEKLAFLKDKDTMEAALAFAEKERITFKGKNDEAQEELKALDEELERQRQENEEAVSALGLVKSAAAQAAVVMKELQVMLSEREEQQQFFEHQIANFKVQAAAANADLESRTCELQAIQKKLDLATSECSSSRAAAAFADNEAGGSIRKPGIKQARRCQDLAFLSIISLLAFGFIVDTSFGFNRGDPHRLVYGLDYKGNVCGDRRAKPNLNHFQVRYWMNPNQLYWSGVYPDRYKLSTTRSICLRNCPTTVSAGNGNTSSQLSWVCDYPEGTYSGLSMRDWEQRNYDYFDLLTPDQIALSRNLTGPCYPVLFESVNCMKSSHLSTAICEGNRLDGRVDLFRDSVHEVV